MQHYGVNGYSLHAMNSLSAMYNLHQQAAQQAQHAPDYRPSVHALTLAERLAGKNQLLILCVQVFHPPSNVIQGVHLLPATACYLNCTLTQIPMGTEVLKSPLTSPSIKLVMFLVSQRLHISRHYP